MTGKPRMLEIKAHLVAAQEIFAEFDYKEMDALLERWYAHARKWVPAFKNGKGHPDRPATQPRWDDLVIDLDANLDELRFDTYYCSETETAYVPLAFFVDPVAWEEADKKEKVSVEEWTVQQHEYRLFRAQEAKKVELEKAAALLREAGWEVNGQ